jgi:heme A synthase
MLFGTAVLVQIYLAGSGIFAAKGPVKDATSLDPHRLLGNILSVLALLLLIAVIVARPSRRVVITVIVLFVLTAVEGFVAMAGDGAPYVGALHPVLAVVIMGLTALVPLWTRNDTAQATA